MKNTIIYSIAVLLAILSAACTETTRVWPEPDAGKPYLQLSSDKAIFDADGGNVTVVVAANVAWDYAAEGDWFAVTRQEDALIVEASINAAPEALTGRIVFRGERDGAEVSAEMELVQRAERSVDLSADGTANCYIARTGRACKFDARIKGNGKGDGRSSYIAAYGVEVGEAAAAELLWEARNDGDKTMSREIIDGAPVYRNGYVSFTTGRSEGNAVIAVRDIHGTILWSWHIWVCDDEITAHDHINPEGRVAAQIMDRNLGALNNTPMDLDNRGMFYQWGRKDPFMPARSPYHADTDGGNIPAYNETNYEVGNGTGSWLFTGEALPLTTPPGNIPNTIQNPMTFLQPYYSDVYDWYCASKEEIVAHSDLWAAEKTIFDPCPPGYKVPGNDLWAIPSGNKELGNGGPAADYDENGVSEKWEWNICKDGGRCWKRTGDYYPMAGNVYYTSINKTNHNYAGGQGFYWTCHPTPETNSVDSYRQDFNPYWASYRVGAHVYSAQIRCVKE